MNRHRIGIAVLTAATVLVTVSACSSGGAGAASSPSASAASSKTYTASDLPPVLGHAERSLGVSGKVLDNAGVQSEIAKLGSSNALSTLLAMPGSSITPASCATMLTNDLSVTPPANTVSSILTFGTTAATVSAVSGKKLPSSLTSQSRSKEAAVLSACGNMTLTVAVGGQSQTVTIALKKADVTTDADTTTAIDEQIAIPGSNGSSTPITTEIVSAVDGNLFITAERAGTTTQAAAIASAPSDAPTPSLAKVIDAIVAAAR